MSFYIIAICIFPDVSAMYFGAHHPKGPISIRHLPRDPSAFNKFPNTMKPGYTIKTYTTTNIMVSSVYSKMEDERGLVNQNLDKLATSFPTWKATAGTIRNPAETLESSWKQLNVQWEMESKL